MDTKKRVEIQLPQQLYDELATLAKEQETTISSIIRRIVKQEINKRVL